MLTWLVKDRKTMKITLNLAKAAGLGVMAAFILATVGCSSPRHQAAVILDGHCYHASAGTTPGWTTSRGSLVSPYGDAPGERDLELTRAVEATTSHTCAGCASDTAHMAAHR